MVNQEVYIKYSNEIVEILTNEGIDMSLQLKNTIQLIVSEACEKGREVGRKDGINIGINRACKDMEKYISSLKVEVE